MLSRRSDQNKVILNRLSPVCPAERMRACAVPLELLCPLLLTLPRIGWAVGLLPVILVAPSVCSACATRYVPRISWAVGLSPVILVALPVGDVCAAVWAAAVPLASTLPRISWLWVYYQ